MESVDSWGATNIPAQKVAPMPLTNTAIKNAKSREKAYRLFDERGLYIEISAQGGKWWRLKYSFEGREKRLSLGTYPDIGLKMARGQRKANCSMQS